MQPPLPLAGLSAPLPLAWERAAPDKRAEVVAMLARLMAQLVEPANKEEHNDE